MIARSPEALAYWRSVFEDVPPQQGLPRDRKLIHTHQPKRFQHDSVVDADVISTVSRVAAHSGCTLDQLLLAAFQALLFRYTEATPIVVAWQLHDRPPAVWPVRVSPLPDQTFLRLLVDVRLGCDRCRMFGHMPLDILSTVVGDDREWRDENVLPIRFSGSGRAFLPAAPLPGELSLSVTNRPDGGVNAGFVGNAHRYGAPFIEALARHYCRVIEGAAGHPGSALIDLDLTTPDENRALRSWSSGPRAARAPDRCDVRFEQQVRVNPDKSAVVFSGGALTYAAMDVRANQMARFLQNRGVGPDVPVAVCLRRSPELVITYLGVVKAGGAVFLLDPSTPAQRRRAALGVVQPAILVTQDPLEEGISGEAWLAVSFDEIAVQLDDQERTAPGNRVTVDSSAFLLATSGSTGAPKIVRKPIGYRRAATGYEAEGLSGPPSDERHLLKTDAGTAFTHAEITRPLFAGGTLFIVPGGAEYDPSELAAFIEKNRISCLLATPSLLSALLDVESVGRCDSLRVIDCVGELLSPELRQRFGERLNRCSLVVSYGCTEALGATCRACSPTDDDPAVVDVGHTAALMEVFVLDPRLRLCPVGVPGDVYLGGELAAEYVNNPRETAERFIPHVFSRAAGARLFRTGDLGRWLPDGCLEILGRRDRQVKIRGYRVELEEVEAVLGQCPGVGRAAAVVRDDEPAGRRIAAYVVTTGGDRVTTREMRNYLKERLPEYMVPSWIVTLPELPLTANGKLDRSALPSPDASACRTSPYEPPQGDLEVMLAAVWADVLDVERVGRNDDFFELGGHSLLAIRMIARLRQECLVEAGVSDVFTHPVFADMARYLESATLWS